MRNKREHITALMLDKIENNIKNLCFFLKLDKGSIFKNKSYYNINKNKKCFILGNGPSLNYYDLGFLNNEIVYCVNEYFRFDNNSFVPKYYFLADPAYFFLKKENKNDYILIKALQNLLSKGTELWIPYKYSKYIQSYNLDESQIRCYLNNIVWTNNYSKLVKFDKNITMMQAVVQYAILHAVYTGVSEIYLLGVEQTDIISTLNSYLNEEFEANYAFDLNESEKFWKYKQMEEYSLADTLYGYSRIFELYDELYRYCKRYDVDLFNCSPKSLIKSIPYYDFMSVFKE